MPLLRILGPQFVKQPSAFFSERFRVGSRKEKTVGHPVDSVRSGRLLLILLENDMEVRRRDPETGTAITINEAYVVIRNDSRRDLVLSVTPRWVGQDGATQEAMFSYEQFLYLPARSSERFEFRAPSRFAERVELGIDCPEDDCVAPR